ncbi:MAG: hydrogenase maturation nickel metallochaperone HypA [Myxococcota bacterium]
MDELALAHRLVALVRSAQEQQQEDGHPLAIDRVFVRLGRILHLDPDTLEVAFDEVTQGTPLEGTGLALIANSGRAFCVPCGEEFTPYRRTDPCLRCGQHKWIPLEGDEVEIVELEVA